MPNPAISIIMPCLNSAEYIAEAVGSILVQSFADFELIVVDSGSTDGTLDILNRYKAKDARVQITHSAKKSVGAQSNIGLDSALGEFICFAEGDDYIAQGMYETLYGAITGSGADYVKSNFDMFVDLPDMRLFYTHGPISEQQSDYYGEILSPEHLCELVRRDIFIWNGIYRRSFILENNIRFQETPGAAFQDAGFVSQLLMNAKSAAYLKDSFYRYRKDNTNASSASVKTHMFLMDEFAYILGKLNPQTKDMFLPAFLRRFFGSFHNCLRQYLQQHGYSSDLARQVNQFRGLFLAHYHALSIPQLSRSDLWPPQNLALFANDFEEYCKVSQAQYASDCSAHLRMAEYLAGQESLIVCGVGENAASVYCYLARCGLRNITAFCTDETCGSYYGKEILSVDQAIRANPNTVYLISQSAGIKDNFKQLLREAGVKLERIIYYGEGLFHHNWYELPTRAL